MTNEEYQLTQAATHAFRQQNLAKRKEAREAARLSRRWMERRVLRSGRPKWPSQNP